MEDSSTEFVIGLFWLLAPYNPWLI